MDTGLLLARGTLVLTSAADRYQSMMDMRACVAHPSVMEDQRPSCMDIGAERRRPCLTQGSAASIHAGEVPQCVPKAAQAQC